MKPFIITSACFAVFSATSGRSPGSLHCVLKPSEMEDFTVAACVDQPPAAHKQRH